MLHRGCALPHARMPFGVSEARRRLLSMRWFDGLWHKIGIVRAAGRRVELVAIPFASFD